MHRLGSEHERTTTDAEKSAHTRAMIHKIARRCRKGYGLIAALGLGVC